MLHDVAHSLAPIIWGGIAVTMIALRHRRKMAEIAATRTAPAPGADHESEVARLRDRVRVLERIATDGAADERRHDSSQSLAARIEALRD